MIIGIIVDVGNEAQRLPTATIIDMFHNNFCKWHEIKSNHMALFTWFGLPVISTLDLSRLYVILLSILIPLLFSFF